MGDTNKRIIKGEKYYHVCLEDVVLLGIFEDVLEKYKNSNGYDIEILEELELYTENPLDMLSDEISYKDILNLSFRDREIILNTLDEWMKLEKKTKIEPLYWNIVIDFIKTIYGATLYDMAVMLVENMESYKKIIESNKSANYKRNIREEEIKRVYDKLLTLSKGKGNPNNDTMELVNKICYYYRIDSKVMKNGKGCYYYIKEESKYQLEEVEKYCKFHSEVNLKEMIQEITGEQVTPIRLEVGVNSIRIKSDIIDLIKILIKEMAKDKV